MTSIESPCVSQCTLDPQDVCIGCGRSLDEIVDWSVAPAARKLDILSAAAARREARQARRRT